MRSISAASALPASERETASAVMRGIRAAGSDAEFVSWFYHPQVRPERAPWCAEVARHLPDGVTLAYNFESGLVEDQLGRPRPGGEACARSGRKTRTRPGGEEIIPQRERPRLSRPHGEPPSWRLF